MGIFKKGDIVIFPFPYTDLSQRKLRPCLVISDEMNEDIILCQITSKSIKKDNFSVELKKEESNIKIDSYVRCNMIFTASKDQIIKKISQINKTKHQEIVTKLISIFS